MALVTAPLGPHTLMAQLMQVRIEQCLSHVLGDAAACDVCHDTHSSNKDALFSDGTDNVYGTTTAETPINEASCLLQLLQLLLLLLLRLLLPPPHLHMRQSCESPQACRWR